MKSSFWSYNNLKAIFSNSVSLKGKSFLNQLDRLGNYYKSVGSLLEDFIEQLQHPSGKSGTCLVPILNLSQTTAMDGGTHLLLCENKEINYL